MDLPAHQGQDGRVASFAPGRVQVHDATLFSRRCDDGLPVDAACARGRLGSSPYPSSDTFCEIIPISPMPKSPNLRCPICKQAVQSSDPDFPFCSERCRTIDLGKWASGQYVISSPLKYTADEFDVESDASRSDDDE